MTGLRSVHVFIPGDPAPQGSKRRVGKGVMVESSKRVQPWRADVRQALEGQQRLTGPIAITATFIVRRPAAHYGSGRNAAVLKTSAPLLPTSRRHGDIDKLCRSTLDAIVSAGTIPDDDMVVTLHARKRYAEADQPTGCLLTITEEPTHRDETDR